MSSSRIFSLDCFECALLAPDEGPKACRYCFTTQTDFSYVDWDTWVFFSEGCGFDSWILSPLSSSWTLPGKVEMKVNFLSGLCSLGGVEGILADYHMKRLALLPAEALTSASPLNLWLINLSLFTRLCTCNIYFKVESRSSNFALSTA